MDISDLLAITLIDKLKIKVAKYGTPKNKNKTKNLQINITTVDAP
jgi:hypothetical protein